jgi:hypothetical protein
LVDYSTSFIIAGLRARNIKKVLEKGSKMQVSKKQESHTESTSPYLPFASCPLQLASTLIPLFIDELVDFGGDGGWIDDGSGLAGFDGRSSHRLGHRRGNAEVCAFGNYPI